MNMKLYCIEITDWNSAGEYTRREYEYGEDRHDALLNYLDKHEGLRIEVINIHTTSKSELLDASRG